VNAASAAATYSGFPFCRILDQFLYLLGLPTLTTEYLLSVLGV